MESFSKRTLNTFCKISFKSLVWLSNPKTLTSSFGQQNFPLQVFEREEEIKSFWYLNELKPLPLEFDQVITILKNNKVSSFITLLYRKICIPIYHILEINIYWFPRCGLSNELIHEKPVRCCHLSSFGLPRRSTLYSCRFPVGFCQSLFINLQQRPTPRKPKHSDSSKMNDLLPVSRFLFRIIQLLLRVALIIS